VRWSSRRAPGRLKVGRLEVGGVAEQRMPHRASAGHGEAEVGRSGSRAAPARSCSHPDDPE
jgi:hypothetical protein